MSQWGGSTQPKTTSSSAAPSPGPASPTTQSPSQPPPASHSFAESAAALNDLNGGRASPSPSQQQRQRSDTGRSSRPMSMIQTYQPPIMQVGQDTLPELQRIFTFLNSHSNKLYQEGYFLKFHDTDARGRPAPDRKWQEYFVQLVGTIMSLWDASELDQVGGDREVIPTFINLTDAAIHMIPAMTLKDGKKLDHILSVSTAAKNKYLLHFDSYHALTQWTAAIRLAMYEHTTLQEAYTGSLIAGKGKFLNNIRMILSRENSKYEDWVRVRFGAGTPWRRCWCVVSPPDQKEYAKLQKDQKSKKNPYGKQTVLKGDIKFYETKKITKKTKPIATIKDAFACYAIYPQSKPLIDSSTLVKIEAKITVHSQPETTTEGFVFVMPESRPAITGFEIMLQFLFPVFDTFNLYGRPKKLIADVLDTRGLMFAMPNDRRYGYLELWDVASLISKDGSQNWSERQWRKQLKDLTSTRMNALPDSDRSAGAGPGGRRNTVSRAGFTPSARNLRFQDGGSSNSQPSTRQPSPTREVSFDLQGPRRVDSAPPTAVFANPRHQRSVSENVHNLQKRNSALAQQHSLDDGDRPPTPPEHGVVYNGTPQNGSTQNLDSSDTDESPSHEPHVLPELPVAASAPPVGPVDQPPSFTHASNQKPPVRPAVPGSASKPNPHVDNATLNQMADVSPPAGVAAVGAAAAWKSQESLHNRRSGDYSTERGQNMHSNAQRPVTREGRGQNRMPTIPASPYVEHAEFVQPPQGYEPVAPPVPEHGVPLQSQIRQELPHRPHSGSSSSGQITRKPVPGRSPSFSQRSTTSSSLGSLRQDVIDPEALDSLDKTETSLFRQQSKSSSRYDDDAISTSTPDYASTYSEEIVVRKVPARREERPRSGVLRTIGDPSMLPTADTTAGAPHPTFDPKEQPQVEVPSIDFGPTYALGFADKPSRLSGTMTPGQMTAGNEFSRSRENLASSPNERPNRNSYISSGRTTPNTALHMRSTSVSPNEFESRQVAWQPSMAAAPRRSSGHKLDAEEWVLHRAAQQSPGLMNYPRQTPPPINRTRSGDWAHLQRTAEGPPSPAARPSSRLTLSRPPSRGAELLLDSKPTTLSAREQEQVARITGTPLLDMSSGSNKKHQQQPSQGLTGYIDFREKEKEKAKQQNRQSAAMQAEIDKRLMQQNQRQMQEQQRQMEARQRQMMEMQNMNQQMAMAQSMYAQSNYAPSMMGTPQGLGTPTGMPGMAYSTPGQAQLYAQQQQQGYFARQQVTPQIQMPGGWVQTPAQSMGGQYFPSQQQQQQQQQYMQQNQNYPPTRPYGQQQQRRY
ncbi:hypothetical protein E8E13_004706 [Curvularia kusanoi]|uniref:PH domain-containing protein n=1 Tax=Curvularia kusanoi TaxID=90978 RepID=A0A9P4W9Z7_CURKU|nr:hypothetical protein E8E13_004706 [Curvularia kusanoi]